jgi:hypothetical protein
MGPESFVIISEDSANTPISVSKEVFPVSTVALAFMRSLICSAMALSFSEPTSAM